MSDLVLPANIPTQQFGREFKLLVSNKGGSAIDLSLLRVKFAVKKSGYQTPNAADIIVYNIDESVALFIKKEFTTVIMQAGYTGNFGTIFKGNIKQTELGRESATDTFMTLVCGDGDQAYNFSIVTQTVGSAKAGGASPAAQLNAATQAMSPHGVTTGYIGSTPQVKLPRGKVMFGNARDYIKNVADTNGFAWSIQDEKIMFLPQGAYLPNQAVILTSKSGMIGTPQQTVEGIKAKCLLNPKIKAHGRVQIDNRSVQKYLIDPTQPGSPANTPASLSNDGVYYVWVIEHSGDTRGTEWYTSMQMLTVDVSANPRNSVQAGSFGG